MVNAFTCWATFLTQGYYFHLEDCYGDKQWCLEAISTVYKTQQASVRLMLSLGSELQTVSLGSVANQMWNPTREKCKNVVSEWEATLHDMNAEALAWIFKSIVALPWQG